ncbi:MAG TPA: hypothetical protein VGV92_06785 [Gammaproteobacteria bacterium]|nr:hypothetical protein [Gammaproteobacteria bacterium]
MRPSDLKLRGYLQKEPDGSWLAVCIDLNLVAQGDTQKEARSKLHVFINDYLAEAFTKDKKYFDDLVPRKAPFIFMFRYYLTSVLVKFHKITHYARSRLFVEHLSPVSGTLHK